MFMDQDVLFYTLFNDALQAVLDLIPLHVASLTWDSSQSILTWQINSLTVSPIRSHIFGSANIGMSNRYIQTQTINQRKGLLSVVTDE